MLFNKLRAFRRWLLLRSECIKDAKRFASAVPTYGIPSSHQNTHLESDIVRRYHVIEKGLAMPDFRPAFGKETVRDLVQQLKAQASRNDATNHFNSGQIAAALSTLKAYRDRHLELGVDLGTLLDGLDLDHANPDDGGVRKQIPAKPEDYSELLRIAGERRSVRTFDPKRIPSSNDLLRAAEIARHTPSVCNRQTCRIHAYSGEIAAAILELQSGNRGFGHRIPVVLVVTSDLRHFTGLIERNQGWIDGGMFAMMLLLGLHASGLGAVALNWSVTNEQDHKLRNVSSIPDYERIIMLIGCGYPEEGAIVPKSRRRNAESILKIHS